MRLLVTGARGLVGYHVAELGLQEGVSIFLTSRGEAPFTHVPYVQADLTNREAVFQLVEAARPMAVIHSAAMTQVDACQEQPALCWQHNVTATRYLIEALVEKAPTAHFILVSTDFVFDGFPVIQRPYVEGDYEAPISVYGASKLAAEAWVKTYPGPWAIARTALVYGFAPTLSRDNILLRILSRLSEHKDYALFSHQVRTPTWAADLAQGLLLLAKVQAQGIYHLAGSDIESPYTFGQKVARTWGLPENLLQPITEEDVRLIAPRPVYSALSIDKAVALGYRPHSTEEALKKLRLKL